MVTLKFNPDLKPYMLKLNSMFTQYKLANVLSMRSKYSPRIYELLKCNEFKTQNYIDIQELRKLLRVEDIYPKYNDFKRFIILRAQKELNKLTDISFDFEEIKTVRKVTGIKFIVYYKKSNSKEKTLNNNASDEISVTLLNIDKDIEDKKTELELGVEQVLKIMKYHEVSIEEALKIYKSAKGLIDIDTLIKSIYLEKPIVFSGWFLQLSWRIDI